MNSLQQLAAAYGSDSESDNEQSLNLDKQIGAPAASSAAGQNALNQVEVFREMIGVTGLIVTKLDGTAKGGGMVALAQKFQLPIYAIGVGEGIEDLDSFEAADFTANLVGMRGRVAGGA